MKIRLLLIASLVLGFLASAPPAFPDDLDTLQGKWSAKRTNDEGRVYTQEIEVNKKKFVFKILRDGEVRLYAEGEVKLEKAGPFKAVTFANIKAGASEGELTEVNDDRASVYVLEDKTWTVASNFDKERDQRPSLEVYRKAESGAK